MIGEHGAREGRLRVCVFRRSGYTASMRKRAQAPNIAIATLWADMLSQAGLKVSVQRYFLSGIAGDLPPDQCLPEVWVTHDEQEPRAKALLHALQNLPQRRWTCSCGERIEGGFEQCWSCSADMPAHL